jgi:methylmalonyl-CoA/ethylmalonyl-CoA epimerase
MLLRMDHVIIATRSLDPAVESLREVTGLQAQRDPMSLEQDCAGRILPVGRCFFNLVQPMSQSGSVHEFTKRYGDGVYAVGFLVDDVETATGLLRSRGVDVEHDAANRISWLLPEVSRGFRIRLVDHSSLPRREEIVRERGNEHYLDCWNLSVAVHDLDETLADYQRMFGLPIWHQAESETWGYRQYTLALRDSESKHGIELLTARDPEKHPAKFLASHGEGVYMLTLSVDSFAGACGDSIKDPRVTIDEESDPQMRFLWFHPAMTARLFLCLSEKKPQSG